MYDEEMEYTNHEDRERAKVPQRTHKHCYRLGETVGDHEVKYWGQEKSSRHGMTALMICPKCDNSWRTNLSKIYRGEIRGCCITGRPKKEK